MRSSNLGSCAVGQLFSMWFVISSPPKVGDFCLVVLRLLGDEERDESLPPHRLVASSTVVLSHLELVEKRAHAYGVFVV